MSDPTAWTPPTGPVEDFGHISRNLNISIIVISSILFVHRVCIRLFVSKNWAADDYAAGCAFALLMTLSAYEIEEVRLGAGKHLVDINPKVLDRFFYNLPTMQLLYMSTSYVVKLSIILFLARLHNGRMYIRAVWTAIALTTIQAVVLFLLFALQCNPPAALWDKAIPNANCLSEHYVSNLFYAHVGIGIGIDIYCLLAPMYIIWKLLMFRDMQIRLTIVFSVGMFAIICAIIRFSVIVRVDVSADTTFNILKVSVWTDLECFVGFFVSCFPSLSPTFRFLRRKINGKSSSHKTSNAKQTPGPITFNMQHPGHNQSALHHGKGGSTGDIPMYSVSGIVKASNDSEDNIAEPEGQEYNDLNFKVHVEKEVYTSKV